MSKKPTVADLMKKIEALEAKIKELKEQPREHHTHFHMHPAPVQPTWPQHYPWQVTPWNPSPWPVVICDSGNGAEAAIVSTTITHGPTSSYKPERN